MFLDLLKFIISGINKLNENFLQLGVFPESVSVDEQMVQCYDHHYPKQFIRGIPVRFGFK